MSRWEPNARGRLEQAALELYAEQGFDQTTVAGIAKRAGLTERTFFRHFADKREVLFGGQVILNELMMTALAGAPATDSPIDAIIAALAAAGGILNERRELARGRRVVIEANPELQERELIKMARLGTELARGLRERGVPETTSSLAAQAGVAVFRVAFLRWLDDPDGRPFESHILESMGQLRAVTAEPETTATPR